MNLIIQGAIITLDEPFIYDDIFYTDIVKMVNEKWEVFGDDYRVSTMEFGMNHQVNVDAGANDYIIKILSIQPSKGNVRILYSVYQFPKPLPPFKFLT